MVFTNLPYTPAIPGIASYGLGGSYGHMGTGITILYVDTLSAASVQTGANSGSLRWCLTRPFKATIILLVSGVIDLADGNITANSTIGSKTLAFQTAPSPGVIIRRGRVFLRGDDIMVWHAYIELGDNLAYPGQTQGMNIVQGDDTRTGGTQRGIFAWCSVYWSIDQAMNSIRGTQYGWINCLLAEPLDNSIHTSGAHGYNTIVDHEVGNWCMLRCALFHGRGRNPLARAIYATMRDSLVYNCNDEFFIWQGRGSGDGVPNYLNVLDNIFLAGPNTPTSRKVVRAQAPFNHPFVAGSQFYLNGNRAIGFSYSDTNQLNLRSIESGTVPGMDASDVLTQALPIQWDNRQQIGDALARLNLLKATVGCRPKDRVVGRDALMFDHAINRYNGTAPQGAIINSQSAAGGYTSAAQNTISDPTNAASPTVITHWNGEPVPNTPETVYSSGTFSDGISRVGYNHLTAWLYERHLQRTN